MDGHVLAKGLVIGLYSNESLAETAPAVRPGFQQPAYFFGGYLSNAFFTISSNLP